MSDVKFSRFIKLFQIYEGLSGDLLFWVALDTLFLTVVKDFSAAQIASLESISLIFCILCQMLLLGLIKKIGNTWSVRLGTFLLLVASILMIFGNGYFVILIGHILYEIAFTFKNMVNIVLRNNLVLKNRGDEYIRYSTNANTIYAFVTMIIALVASVMFNFNHYLPMVCCIVVCAFCFVLSFGMVDYSSGNCDEVVKKNFKVSYSKIIFLIFCCYGLFFPIASAGQTDGKLFIQQELFKSFDVETTALIIGVILFVSRFVRLISNVLFNRVHKKIKDKVCFLIPLLLVLSISLMVCGYFISDYIVAKILVMGFGYVIILLIRDPFWVYLQDMILNNCLLSQQQTMLTVLDLSRKIIGAIISLCFTFILISNPMIVIMIIILILSVVEFFISLYLYKLVLRKGA